MLFYLIQRIITLLENLRVFFKIFDHILYPKTYLPKTKLLNQYISCFLRSLKYTVTSSKNIFTS